MAPTPPAPSPRIPRALSPARPHPSRPLRFPLKQRSLGAECRTTSMQRRTHVAPAALRSLTAHCHLLPSWSRNAPPTTDPHRTSAGIAAEPRNAALRRWPTVAGPPSLAHRARRSRAFGWALPRAAKRARQVAPRRLAPGGSPKNPGCGLRASGLVIRSAPHSARAVNRCTTRLVRCARAPSRIRRW